MFCIFLILISTSCQTGIKTYQEKLESPPEKTEKLVLYRPPMMGNLFDHVLPIYKASHPEVEVEVKNFGDSFEDVQNYQTLLTTELMAGQGPDLLLWDGYPYSDDSYRDFGDVYKVMDAGIFYNLDNFIQNDSEFHREDYNQAVFDAGVYKGERQFIPLYYGVSIISTSKECLEKNGYSLSDNPTYDEFSKIITDFCEKNKDEKGKQLTNYSGIYRENDLGELLYPFNGLEVLDYEQGTVNVDSEAFRQTMETYKGIHNTVKDNKFHYTDRCTPEEDIQPEIYFYVGIQTPH